MTLKQTIIALIIHLFLPLSGLFWFLVLKRKMKRDNVVQAPIIELFVVFATYGGLLLVALTTYFWEWSGMASLGIFYLILGAPIAMAIIALKQRKFRDNSKYHRWAYRAGLFYFVIAPLTFFILFSTSKT